MISALAKRIEKGYLRSRKATSSYMREDSPESTPIGSMRRIKRRPMLTTEDMLKIATMVI